MHILCGRPAYWVAVLGAVFLSARVAAADDWIERSRQILEHSAEQPAPEWLRREPSPEALADAQDLLGNRTPAELSRRSATAERADDVLIFGSLDIPPPTLKALLDEATHEHVTFVLRGVPKGLSIPQTIGRVRAMLANASSPPTVIIDPTLFRRYHVEVVPTWVLTRERGLPPVVVEGAVTLSWLRRMASSVVRGQENLGHRAETYAIGERDLVLEMQERMAKIDWDALRARALDRFWKRPQAFVPLQDAPARREFVVDPSVRVTEDLSDADGNLLVRSGDTFNPLEWVTLTKSIIVFRGTDSRQVKAAQRLTERERSAHREVILLTTEIDTQRGWSHLDELERSLQGAVYVLPASLAEQFHLQYVPSRIAASGKRLLVTELPPGDLP